MAKAVWCLLLKIYSGAEMITNPPVSLVWMFYSYWYFHTFELTTGYKRSKLEQCTNPHYTPALQQQAIASWTTLACLCDTKGRGPGYIYMILHTELRQTVILATSYISLVAQVQMFATKLYPSDWIAARSVSFTFNWRTTRVMKHNNKNPSQHIQYQTKSRLKRLKRLLLPQDGHNIHTQQL